MACCDEMLHAAVAAGCCYDHEEVLAYTAAVASKLALQPQSAAQRSGPVGRASRAWLARVSQIPAGCVEDSSATAALPNLANGPLTRTRSGAGWSDMNTSSQRIDKEAGVDQASRNMLRSRTASNPAAHPTRRPRAQSITSATYSYAQHRWGRARTSSMHGKEQKDLMSAVSARSVSRVIGVDRVRALQRVLYRCAKQDRDPLSCPLRQGRPQRCALEGLGRDPCQPRGCGRRWRDHQRHRRVRGGRLPQPRHGEVACR